MLHVKKGLDLILKETDRNRKSEICEKIIKEKKTRRKYSEIATDFPDTFFQIVY